MDPKFLALLRCPYDRSNLAVLERELTCKQCDCSFPIDHGIPRFVKTDTLGNEQARELAARDFNSKPIALKLDDLPEVDAIRSSLSLRKVKVAFDAGCGGGKVTPILAHAERTIAMDFAFDGLLQFVAHDKYRCLNLLNGDVTRVPLADATVELIVSSQVIQHMPMPEARLRMISELRRVLTDNGRLILTGYHAWVGQECQEGHHDNGIFFHRMADEELRRDLSVHFKILKLTGARIRLPRTHRLVRTLGAGNVLWERMVRPLPFALKYAAAFVAVCEPI